MKLWGGRFEGGTHKDVELFTSSLALDSRLWRADIKGSIAHAEMLGEQNILSSAEAKNIVTGLKSLEEEIAAGKLELPTGAEDIHSALEMLLTERIGAVAGKLHTARSRNDQVATACRIYLREETIAFDKELESLQRFLQNEAAKHVQTLLPGLTHMQHAQPVSLAHHLLAYFWMLGRDRERLRDFYSRLNRLPLGSGALAGTTLSIKRESVAQKLGFSSVCENSLDAVSDRDFVVEFLSAAALIGTHLSRLAEELVIWSAPEYGFIEMADEVTTGSSLMPQKKNPDVAELLRGRTGRLYGALVGALTMLKSLPLSYNRDLQEDKVHLFEALDSVRASVRLTQLILEKTRWKPERMAAACKGDYSNATDLADYLVRKGVPFRETHEVAGKAVRWAIAKGVALEAIPLAELKNLHASFEKDVFALLDPMAVMSARNSRGGTGTDAVKDQLRYAEDFLKGFSWKK
jgi:argininosuccinate lyase